MLAAPRGPYLNYQAGLSPSRRGKRRRLPHMQCAQGLPGRATDAMAGGPSGATRRSEPGVLAAAFFGL